MVEGQREDVSDGVRRRAQGREGTCRGGAAPVAPRCYYGPVDLCPEAGLHHRHFEQHDGPAPAAAKRELLQAVDGLTEDTQFSIVAFNSMVHPWQRQLVPANASMKQAAARWINMLEANSMTASYDALEAGLRFDAEALYFLTDGEPHGGKVTATGVTS